MKEIASAIREQVKLIKTDRQRSFSEAEKIYNDCAKLCKEFPEMKWEVLAKDLRLFKNGLNIFTLEIRYPTGEFWMRIGAGKAFQVEKDQVFNRFQNIIIETLVG